MEEVMAIKNNNLEENITPPTEDSDLASLPTLSLDEVNTDTVVGFDDDFLQIKQRMYQQSSTFEVIPVVGMGGIGKSTLTRKLYDESTRSSHFDRCAWIVVSQKYSIKELLLGLIRSIKKEKCELHQKRHGELVEIVHKEPHGRRYLIVVDDIWSTEAWDKLQTAFPQDNKGSRILLTTRLSGVASYVGSPHEMYFLDEVQSWRLLKDRVFKTESCPSHLEPTGKKIAKSCQGLPLTVVLVSGILKANTTREYWESISRNMSLTEPTIALQCSKVLSLSYEHLPFYLKPCFLYVAVFPEDYEINANRLIRLWMAEGFVKSSSSEGLEDVAEGYLKDLVGRSLLLVPKKRYDDSIKCIGIHDVLRDFGTQKTQEERFHYHGLVEKRAGKERRLSIITTEVPWSSNPEIFSVYDFVNIPDPKTRSLLIFNSTKVVGQDDVMLHLWYFRLLRILDALDVLVVFDPEKLVHLRYLAIKHNGYKFPPSVSKMQNLQTLIVHGRLNNDLSVPVFVWTMPSLRHLLFLEDCRLDQPTYKEGDEETNLHTLSLVTNLSITKRVVKKLANVKKLGLYYTKIRKQSTWDKLYLHNLVHLAQVEKLKIIFQCADGHWWPDVLDIKWAFPDTIKELTLDNIHRPWEDMTIVGSLPNLEVLKIRRFAFTGREWNPIEGQFLKLKYLEMVDACMCYWGADYVHFPELEDIRLIFYAFSPRLEEFPSGIWEIDSLKVIHLSGCKTHIVESVMNSLAEQRDMGNEVLQVVVHRYKYKKWP